MKKCVKRLILLYSNKVILKGEIKDANKVFFFSQNINFLCILLLKMSFRKKYQIDYYIYSTVINFY